MQRFVETLPKDIKPQSKHDKILAHLAENGLRQLGPPRIGVFAERIRPEPLHLEINSWTHVLDVIYREAIRRGRFEAFLEIMRAPVKMDKDDGKLGCGMRFIAKSIQEHYDNVNDRLKKLEVRLIGAQAIALAKYSYRLIDVLQIPGEKDNQRIKRLALAKICETLRDIGSEMNRVTVEPTSYVQHIKTLCVHYFNLFSLFFTESCQSTVWTAGYALPYHVKKIFEQYGCGYGITSMQGKESKHSAIKQELKMGTNRSSEENEKGKWHQIMRSSFVRNFYLPYHFPLMESYKSHYTSRTPKQRIENCCHCSREVHSEVLCKICIDALKLSESYRTGILSDDLIPILNPIKCQSCSMAFADQSSCNRHIKKLHGNVGPKINTNSLIPSTMTVNQLKDTLKGYNKPVTGNKKELQKRLEGVLTR